MPCGATFSRGRASRAMWLANCSPSRLLETDALRRTRERKCPRNVSPEWPATLPGRIDFAYKWRHGAPRKKVGAKRSLLLMLHLAGRPVNRPADQPADQQARPQADRQADRQTDRLANRPANRPAEGCSLSQSQFGVRRNRVENRPVGFRIIPTRRFRA